MKKTEKYGAIAYAQKYQNARLPIKIMPINVNQNNNYNKTR